VDPSSLIFVVIVGIWAVYLLQHWVRRREQLATSRSIDRFSEAMRVLERRAPIPVALPTSQNRPYVVAPVSARSLGSGQVEGSPEVAMKQAPIPRNDRPAAAGGLAVRPASAKARPLAANPQPRAARAPRRRTHRVRALILLTLLVATPACWAAHTWGTLLLWPTLTVTALLVLDLLFVRSVARRAAARRRMTVRRAHPQRMAAGQQPKTFPASGARPVRPAKPAAASASAMSYTSTTAVAERSEVAVVAASVHSQDAITEVIVLEGAWEPVAVPPPTYTMKPKADRPAGAQVTLEADSDSAPAREPIQPAVVIDELDLDTVLERRRAAGE
jgi:hypothetical protein